MRIVLIFLCLAIRETICARPKRSHGGMQISIKDAPYFVSLRRNGRHVCGGAFISPRHVLTAAKCVLDDSMKPVYTTRVVSGTNREYRTDIGEPIINITLHDGFLRGHLWCDIAVITISPDTMRTSANIEGSKIRWPIPLPDEEPEEYEYANFVAFEDYTPKRKNAVLQQLTVMMHPDEEASSNADHRDYMIYGVAEDGQLSTNPTDRGGPLVYGERLVGIASRLAEPDLVDRYYIKVFKFKNFIENSMADEKMFTSKCSSQIPWPAKRPRL